MIDTRVHEDEYTVVRVLVHDATCQNAQVKSFSTGVKMEDEEERVDMEGEQPLGAL